MIFPSVQGDTVSGKAFRVPDDFRGRYNVVLLAFTQEHQLLVNTWMPFLRHLKQGCAHIGVYEVPVLKEFSLPERWLIDYWMRTGIPDQEVRDTTITLYTDVDAFLTALDLSDRSTIHVLLVDPQGKVYWQTTGAYAPDKLAELTSVLNELMEPVL